MRKLGKLETKNHGLEALIGKTILDISMQEYDIHDDGSNVRQYYHIKVKGEEEDIIVTADGNNSAQYAEISTMTEEEFQGEIEDNSDLYDEEP